MTTIRHLQVTIDDGSGPPGQAWTKGLDGPEQDLVNSAATGALLNLPQGATPPDEAAMPEVGAMGGWGPNRIIRAEMLRHLLVESEWPVHAKGVHLQGALITGKLDLESATLRCPLVLTNCHVQQPVALDCATSPRLGMSRCLLAGLAADLLIVTKELDLSGSVVTGTVQLLGAQITGQLICRDTKIEGTDKLGNSLTADEATVGGTVFLDSKFATQGAVRLPRANIKGLLLCRNGAHIKGKGKDGYALNAEEVSVRGSAQLDGFTADGPLRLVGASFTGQLNLRKAHVSGADLNGQAVFADGITVGGLFLDQEFTAAGAVRLFGANINGDLRCTDARIAANNAGYALAAERTTVTRSVFLDGGFTAGGAVRLAGATVKGELRCTDAKIAGNKDDNALEADGVTVGGDVSLNGEFTAAGSVRLSGARIDGGLSLDGATLEAPATKINDTLRAEVVAPDGPAARIETASDADGATPRDAVAFMAEGARIGQELLWAPTAAVKGIVSLERTQLHRLDDDWGEGTKERKNAYWPAEGRLRLAGFVYDGFGGERQATWVQRLDWIRGQHQSPKTGNARNFDPQPYQQLARAYRQAGKDEDALKIAIKQRRDLRTYGSLKWWQKAGNWLLGLTISHGYRPLHALMFLALVWIAAFAMFFTAQQKNVMVPTARDGKAIASECTRAYPCFAPAGYAIDITIPIIQTGQATSWRPDGDASRGWLYIRSAWVFTGLGWALTTLAAAGYTGLIRRD